MTDELDLDAIEADLKEWGTDGARPTTLCSQHAFKLLSALRVGEKLLADAMFNIKERDDKLAKSVCEMCLGKGHFFGDGIPSYSPSGNQETWEKERLAWVESRKCTECNGTGRL